MSNGVLKRLWREDRRKMLAMVAENRRKINNQKRKKHSDDWRREHPAEVAAIVRKAARAALPFKIKIWHLRDPRGREYHFKDLNRFTREHPNLFAPEDVNLVQRGDGGTYCRASKGLGHLSPRIKWSKLSWKGWTWISIVERRFDDGADPLARNLEAAA